MSAFLLDSSASATLSLLRRPETRIVIYGSGKIGRLTLDAARRLGIRVTAFCDGNARLTGTSVEGVPVLSPAAAATKFPDAYFFIAMYMAFSVFPALQDLGLAGRCLTIDIIEAACPGGPPGTPGYLMDSVRQTTFAQRTMTENDSLYLGSLILAVTDYCSLRCRDCSNLIPYIGKPRHRDADAVVADLDRFLAYVDGVYEAQLIGGDAVLHPDIDRIAERVAERDKVRRVMVFTNSVAPLDAERWRRLAGGKTAFRTSDYGSPRQDIAGWEESLTRMGFEFYVKKLEKWSKIGIGGAANPDRARNRRIFRTCVSGECTTLADGRLYRCSIVPNAAALGRIPDAADNYLELPAAGNDESFAETKAKIRRFFVDKAEMAACSHCTGSFSGESENIEPAVQL